MHRADSGFVRAVHYGFDAEHIFFRLDTDKRFHDTVPFDARILVRIGKPKTVLLHCSRFADRPSVLRVLNANGQLIDKLVLVGEGDILELGCPLNLLAAQPGDEIKFHVKVVRVGAQTQRIPLKGAVHTIVPSVDP